APTFPAVAFPLHLGLPQASLLSLFHFPLAPVARRWSHSQLRFVRKPPAMGAPATNRLQSRDMLYVPYYTFFLGILSLSALFSLLPFGQEYALSIIWNDSC